MKLPTHEDWINEKLVETVMKAKGVERSAWVRVRYAFPPLSISHSDSGALLRLYP